MFERQPGEEARKVVDEKVDRPAEEPTGPDSRIRPIDLPIGTSDPGPCEIPTREPITADGVGSREADERTSIGWQQQVKAAVGSMPLRNVELDLDREGPRTGVPSLHDREVEDGGGARLRLPHDEHGEHHDRRGREGCQ